jgi:hypothetical protein
MPLFSIAFSSFRAPQMALFTRHFAGCQRTSRVGIMRAMFYCEFATTPHPSNINDSCCKHLFVALQPQILIFDRSTCDGGGGTISMALFFIKPRSLFDASMKNLFESIARELMTYIIINDVEIFTRELS